MAGKFSIYKYVKLLEGKGWRYARAAYHPNGKIKPNVVLVKGMNGKNVEEKHPEGSYFLNFNNTWIPVGEDALEAQHQRKLRLHQIEYVRLSGKTAAPRPNLVQLGRRVIKDEADAYLANLELAKRPYKTVGEKRRFLTSFLRIVPKKFVDEFSRNDVLTFRNELMGDYDPEYVGKLKQLRRLADVNHSKLEASGFGAGYVGQNMVGLGLAWSYHRHNIDVRCRGRRTVREAFEDDKIFRKAIDKALERGTYMTDAAIRKSLRSIAGTQGVSNFRPVAAASLYHAFCPKGGTVYDPSAGYSGRLLGAWSCRCVARYIGTDPCELTFKGLQETAADLVKFAPTRKLEVKLKMLGSEDFQPAPGSVDCIVTSPPYRGLERYSDEETQSWKKFPTRDAWMEGFMKPTLMNCRVAHSHLALVCTHDDFQR